MQPSELYAILGSQGLDPTQSPAALADAINAAVIITRLDVRVTTTTLLDQVTPDEYGVLRLTLDAMAEANPFAAGIREALAGAGVLMSDDRSIVFVDEHVRPALLQGVPDELANTIADKVIALGVRSEPVLTEQVTADAVVAALTWRDNDLWLADRYNAAREALDAGGSRDDIVAALTAE